MPHRRRRPARPGAWLVALLGAAVLAGCTSSTVGTGAPVAPSAEPALTAPPSVPATQRALPLYYAVGSSAGLRLAREFRRLPLDADPGTAAITALLAAPAGTVPGHRNLWAVDAGLAAPVTHEGGVVTVDLNAAAAGTRPDDPTLAVQQLVYTVTGALGTADPVRLLVAGDEITRLWDVDISRPVPRADPLDVRLLVGIDDPAEGAALRSPVRVSGEAAVFEATLLWEVRQNGAVVRSGVTSTAEGQRFAPYAFSLDLPPGEYEIQVAEDDPSAGEGRAVMTDSRRITVTP